MAGVWRHLLLILSLYYTRLYASGYTDYIYFTIFPITYKPKSFLTNNNQFGTFWMVEIDLLTPQYFHYLIIHCFHHARFDLDWNWSWWYIDPHSQQQGPISMYRAILPNYQIILDDGQKMNPFSLDIKQIYCFIPFFRISFLSWLIENKEYIWIRKISISRKRIEKNI